MAGTEQKRTVYLSFHENFVREGIPYTDKATGEQRTFKTTDRKSVKNTLFSSLQNPTGSR